MAGALAGSEHFLPSYAAAPTAFLLFCIYVLHITYWHWFSNFTFDKVRFVGVVQCTCYMFLLIFLSSHTVSNNSLLNGLSNQDIRSWTISTTKKRGKAGAVEIQIWIYGSEPLGRRENNSRLAGSSSRKWEPGFWNLSQLLLSQLISVIFSFSDVCLRICPETPWFMIIGCKYSLSSLSIVFQASMGSATDKGYIVSVLSNYKSCICLIVLI